MAGTVHEGIVFHNSFEANVPHPVYVHKITLEPESPHEEQPVFLPAQPEHEPLKPCPLTRKECEQHAYKEATTI